ncbi:hypothetical protein HH310_37235 [Actinoplanes sp. TBRC 11911]|uniref:DUF6461 domain-containing protein n=1 Tax=Actinoplanes sp. TBRC 11911 TaxID=2729386 RepID=UPI00145E875E|nr:DUF6461 domain-containing protein [Actinoplanes sp. TBRC 11911]NMO56805.1 hypothetical protein [Actinoplanes sp. TBRC 11911]
MTAAPEPSGPARPAVAADYRWFASNADLSKGFSFVWVKGLQTGEVLDRLGAKELERVYWKQLVGSGDGQRGNPGRRFFGVTRIDDGWTLVVEDNGALGTTESLLRPLSSGTTVISHYRASNHRGRLLMLTDRGVDLDFDPLTAPPRPARRTSELASVISAVGFGSSTDPDYCTAAAFALTERLTGVRMTEALLTSKTYRFSAV